MPTIYSRLKRIAAKTIKAYHSDLTVHDRAACRKFKPHSTAIWTPREYGTHFIWCAQPDDAIDHKTLDSLRHALNWFDAVVSVFGSEDWYLLECAYTPQHGHVTKLDSTSEARDFFVRRIKALEKRLTI